MVVLNISGYLLLLASGLLMIQGVWALVISLDWNTRGRSFCVEKTRERRTTGPSPCVVSFRCEESGNLNNL